MKDVGLVILIFSFGFLMGLGVDMDSNRSTAQRLTKGLAKEGENIQNIQCSERGCSILIEAPNKSRSWVWLPRN